MTTPTTRKPTTTPVRRVAKKVTPAARVTKTAPNKHPLAHLVPPPWYSDEYLRQQFAGVEDVSILRYARAEEKNVLTFGQTGTGKTSAVYAFAAEDEIPLVNVPCNGAIDPATLFGRTVINDDGTIGYIESDITLIMRYGGIINLDEINFMPPRVAAIVHPALDKRRYVTIPELGNIGFALAKTCQFTASYNPGYEGTRPLNAAFKNRFPIKLNFEYKREIEEELVGQMPILLEIAAKLRAQFASGDIETPISTNMLMEFQDHAMALSPELAELIFTNSFAEHERSAVIKAVEHVRDQIIEQRNTACGITDEDDLPDEELEEIDDPEILAEDDEDEDL